MRPQLNLEALHAWQFTVNFDIVRLIKQEGELLQLRGGYSKRPEIGVVLEMENPKAR